MNEPMHAALRATESFTARVAVTLILSATAAIVAVARLVRRPASKRVRVNVADRRRVMLVGTFYNDAWFDAHVAPLLACDAVEHVTVVTDSALRPMSGVAYAIPPKWLRRIVGRTIARSLVVMHAARSHRCDVLVGYHIMPNALICLIAGRLLRRHCIYQMTGGPIQLIGGGVGSENTLLRRQRKSGRMRERLMHHLVRQFDLVIVRGRKGLDYLQGLGMGARAAIIPAGIDASCFQPRQGEPAEFELISVGRLVQVKRYDRLLRIVAALVKHRPDVGCAIVGDGPQRGALESSAKALGIERNVRFFGQRSDVAMLLRRGRLFVLTSESEGQSIAMMEAMTAGLPVAAPDVGELTDLLHDGETGIVIDPENATATAARIHEQLGDDARLGRMAAEGRKAVVAFAATDAVARKWSVALGRLCADCEAPAGDVVAASGESTKSKAALAASAAGSDT